MIFFTLLMVGLIMSISHYMINHDDITYQTLIKRFLFYTIVFNTLIMSIFKYVLGYKMIPTKESFTLNFSIKYILTSIIIGFIFININKIIIKKYNIVTTKSKMSIKSIILSVVQVLLFGAGAASIFFANWFIDTVGEITTEQFMFNLYSPLTGTSEGMVAEIISIPVAATALMIVLFLILLLLERDIYISIKDTSKKIISRKIMKRLTLIISFTMMIGGISYGVYKLKIHELATAYLSSSDYIEKNYRDPRRTQLEFPNKDRNLIHIYLESVETSYLSKELGGYMETNLMPELTELALEGIHFSHNDKFGGPHQTYGSSWSVASMVNMSSGLPLKVPSARNAYGLDGSFLPGVITIGDILESRGYNQTIMFGADADFGGLTEFFTTHGEFNIFDVKAAREKGLIPPTYSVWWGFEDDKLYDFAKSELTRLHNEGKPFNFTMETADTHYPDGYMSKNAEKKYDSQYSNVIAYSSQEAVKFIRWIQEQPFYENTTVVITGDHLSMDKNYFKDFDPNYRRSVFNLILNSPVTTDNTKNREFAPYDFFPTILASMDIKIKGDRLGLGTNLFSNKKTLIERDGLETLSNGLEKKSEFFDNEFLSKSKTSVYK